MSTVLTWDNMKPKAQEKKKKETHISPAVVEENKRSSSKLRQDQQDEKQRVLISIKESKRLRLSVCKAESSMRN